MSKRARLDYVQFDVECIDKPRFQAFLDSVDPIAGLFLIQLWLKIGRAENAKLERKYASSLCHSVRCPKNVAETAIEIALQEGLLDLIDDVYLTLGRIAEDQEHVAQKRESWRNQKNGGTPDTAQSPDVFRPDSARNPAGMVGDSGETLKTEHLNTEPEVLDLEITVPPESIPDDADEFLKLAYEKLEKPKNQPWTRKALFVNTGRRPMKDYPSIHITPPDLAHVLRTWVEAHIPGEKFGHGFLSAEMRARDAVQRGKDPPNVSAWLLGFVMNDLMQSVTTETRMRRANAAPNR